MKVVYALDNIDKNSASIFLAGPTYREAGHRGWRKDAIEYLADFNGEVYYPEAEDGTWHGDYPAQLLWEWSGLESADFILFWVPRDMDKLPGLTTNVEFGLWLHSKKAFLGYPEGAVGMDYLAHAYRKVLGMEPFNDLEEFCESLLILGDALEGFK